MTAFTENNHPLKYQGYRLILQRAAVKIRDQSLCVDADILLADALDTVPDALMDWGGLLASETERQDKMQEVLPLIIDGISIEGRNQKYILVKAPAHGGKLESELRSALLTLYQLNNNGQDTKMRTLRILGELVSTLDARDQEKLVSYGEFLDAQSQQKKGVSVQHPYQRE